METQEPTSDLLNLAVQKYYCNRPDILEAAKKLIRSYVDENKNTYEMTLGLVYEKLKDLPPDILLYFLTTIPLPKNRAPTRSVLFNLMSQMDGPTLHSKMRPILLEYLNGEASVPFLAPLSSNSKSTNISSQLTSISVAKPPLKSVVITPKKPIPKKRKLSSSVLRSVIDTNIQEEKNKKKRVSKSKKNKGNKTHNTESLALICAGNVYKDYKNYCSMYKKLKSEAWKMVTSNTCNANELAQCYNVLRDVNKKLLWLNMFRTGVVPRQVIEEEYGQSDVFYKQYHDRHDNVSEDVLTLSDEVLKSIDVFIDKCSKPH